MPTLARWYIRTSLVWLFLALTLGVALFLLPPNLPAGAMVPVQIHAFVVGWITQLIFGVVYWMFPKASLARPRGSPSLAVAAYVLLNLGLALRVIGEPLGALNFASGPWLVASAGLQWLAGLAFVVNTWPRVKGT